MKIKGAAYTPFAILAASIMVAIAFSSTTSVQNNPISPEYLYTIQNSWETTQGIYAEDSLQEFTALVDLDNPANPTRTDTESALASMIETGVYDGVQERTATYENWSQQTRNHSNKLNSLGLSDLEVRISNVSINTSSRLKMQSQQISKTIEANNTRHISNVDDLLLQNNGFNRKINRCTHKSLAEKMLQGNASSGTVRGDAEVEPNTSSPNLDSTEVLITSDVTNYSETDVQNAAGYFSQRDPGMGNRDNYNQNFTVGTTSMHQIKQGDKVILHDGLWKSNFEESINTGCYMPTSLAEAPTIIERLNDEAEGSSAGRGIYTVLDPSSGQSDIAFERINSNSENKVEIETISEPGAYPNYSMSQSLAQETGLEELVK